MWSAEGLSHVSQFIQPRSITTVDSTSNFTIPKFYQMLLWSLKTLKLNSTTERLPWLVMLSYSGFWYIIPFINSWLSNSPKSQLSLFTLGTSKSWLLHLEFRISNPYNITPRFPDGAWRLQNINCTACSHTLHSEGSSIASGSFVSSDASKRKSKKKMSLGDLPQNNRPAVKWARKYLLMDLLTMVLWSQNESEEDQDIYLTEVLNQVNIKFGTRMCQSCCHRLT
jgi:hypothetical protein